jgi:hypothetical protein
MGSGVKMKQNKQSNNKVIYDRNFHQENKAKYSQISQLKYYAKLLKMSKIDVDEMVKTFGDIHTIQLLKKRVLELEQLTTA